MEVITSDVCLLAIGWIPYTNGLGLENIKVSLDKSGRIPVDQTFMTT